MTDIREVLDKITELNLNKCAITTYDVNIMESVRRAIIMDLAREYGIDYQIKSKETDRIFPVPNQSRFL
jgi:hypothetical protein